MTKFKEKCPFCGTKVEFRKVGSEALIMVVCSNCGTLGNLHKTIFFAKMWFSTRNGRKPKEVVVKAITNEPMDGEDLESKSGVF